MRFTDTQPLEEATPVVPETAATVSPDELRVPTGEGGERFAAAETAAGEDTAETETYPESPAGSAGHP